jgi:hypothetical protein
MTHVAEEPPEAMVDTVHVAEEPPEAMVDTVHVRVRLPDGERVSRRFTLTQQMEVKYFFHGLNRYTCSAFRMCILLLDLTML